MSTNGYISTWTSELINSEVHDLYYESETNLIVVEVDNSHNTQVPVDMDARRRI